MASFKSYLVRFYLHYTKFKNRNRKSSIQVQRKVLDAIGRKNPIAPNTQIIPASASGIPITWILPQHTHALTFDATTEIRNEKMFFYVHGGGFRIGSVQSHKAMVSQLSYHCGIKSMMVTYRLAPESPFPYGLDDVMSAYCWLIEHTNPQNIILAGDSAGGGLLVSLVIKLLEDKLPTPYKVVLFAPWVDLAMESDTIRTFFDPLLRVSDLVQASQEYATKYDKKNPFISPIYADVSQFVGFPPTLIQVGTLDRLLGENKILHEKLLSANVKTTLSIWQNMIHVWQFIAHDLPEGKRTWQEIKDFLQKEIQ